MTAKGPYDRSMGVVVSHVTYAARWAPQAPRARYGRIAKFSSAPSFATRTALMPSDEAPSMTSPLARQSPSGWGALVSVQAPSHPSPERAQLKVPACRETPDEERGSRQ